MRKVSVCRLGLRYSSDSLLEEKGKLQELKPKESSGGEDEDEEDDEDSISFLWLCDMLIKD